MSKQVEQIIKQARAKVSEYCVSHCDADCCQRGSLHLPAGEAALFNAKEGERIPLDPCPMLQNGRCTVYEKRPTTCSTFPIRQLALGGRDVVSVSRCRAVDNAVIDEEIVELESMGCEVYR